MLAVGHLALGYLSGKAASKLLDVDISVPFLFLLSALPDIDVVMYRFGLEHRGPTHSLILFGVLFIPIFLVLKKNAFPYFVALAQHSLLGDLPTDGVQLFWPLSSDWVGISLSETTSMISVAVEWAAFLGAMLLLFGTKDLEVLVKPHRSNLVLLVPLGFVSFSLLVSVMAALGLPGVLYYSYVSTILIVPHVAFFILFMGALLVDLIRGERHLGEPD